MIRTSAALVAFGLALTVAACGGSSGPSESSFKTAYAASKTQLTALGNDVGNDVNNAKGQTDASLAAQFTALSTRATAEVAALKALKTPAKYQAPLTTLEDALASTAGDIHSIASAANAHDANGAKTATESLLLDAKAVKGADNALSSELGLPITP